MSNRKERRAAEKSLGLFKELKKMSKEERAAIEDRRRKVGKEMHLLKVQELENRKLKEDADQWNRLFNSLIEQGKTPEEATAIVENNRAVEAKKLEKKLKRNSA